MLRSQSLWYFTKFLHVHLNLILNKPQTFNTNKASQVQAKTTFNPLKIPHENHQKTAFNPHHSTSTFNFISEISTRDGNVIVIREAPTSSSSDSNFTDPETDQTLHLTVVKLQQLDLIRDQLKLEICRHENVNFFPCEEMPIVKSSEVENGTKGFFGNVSRVKKVELSEISLASDICAACEYFISLQWPQLNVAFSTLMISLSQRMLIYANFAAPPEPQTVTSQIQSSGSNNVKANGNSVLQRVISLTTGDGNLSAKPPAKPTPAYVPEKLHFSAYEKFEGERCLQCHKRKEVNWSIAVVKAAVVVNMKGEIKIAPIKMLRS
jgi:hypothetical protein